MTISYRTLPNGETIASSDELPQMLESEEGSPSGLPRSSLTVYDDGAAPQGGSPGHNPTIGYGINLRVSANLAIVLNQIVIQGQTVFQKSSSSPQTIVQAFENIIAQYPSPTYPNAATLESALSTQLGSYWGLTPAQSAGQFQLSDLEAKNIVNQIVQGYTIPGYSAQSLYQQLSTYLTGKGVPAANIPPANSPEAVALGSLWYNQNGTNPLIGPQLIAALEDGNRAQVWYQIRYRSNAGWSSLGSLQQGLAVPAAEVCLHDVAAIRAFAQSGS